MNVVDALERRAEEAPAHVALIAGRRSVSYGALARRAVETSALLTEAGIACGDRVLLYHAPTIDLYVALTALFRVGATVMVVEPAGGAALLAAACAIARPAALLASPRAHLLRLTTRALRTIPIKLTTGPTVLPAIDLRRAPAHPAPAIADVAPEEAALITFTSGSTGMPKAAVRTHATLLAQRAALAPILAGPCDVELCTLPIVVLANLANGATTVLPGIDLRVPARADGRALVRSIAAHGCTRITAPPAILERIVAACPSGADALARLEVVVTGGGPVFPRLVADVRRAAPGANVVAVYGSTEAEPIAHVSHAEITADDLARIRGGAGLLAGGINPATDVRILAARADEPPGTLPPDALDALTLPDGAPGEIVVAGNHVVAGYLDGVGDEETKIRVAGRTWHRTGDLGWIDDQARLWLLGRARGAIHDDAGAMYPFAVEAAVRERFAVRDVAALAVDGHRTLVLGADASRIGESELLAAIPWARIDRIVRVRAIPMDRRHNSKVDHDALVRAIRRANSMSPVA